MSETTIPEHVRKFLHKHIHSVEQFEILMLLVREPIRFWSVKEMNQIICSNESSVEARLRDLAKSGLLEVVPADDEIFRLQPDCPEAPVLLEMDNLYKKRRLAVIEAIYAKAPTRLNMPRS
jgi:hypothetical protein